ncbi:MAG: hypothetical protein FWH02_05220 [Oscillospiraceae bacterium]|nr:hypothetical protein [Oscillospiraceae bacterium]
MYPYCEIYGAEIAHSARREENLLEYVMVYVERLGDRGLDTLTYKLPDCTLEKREGFPDTEVQKFTEFVKKNLLAIWEYSEKGGAANA